MASNVDPTFPPDGEKVAKSDWRGQQAVIKSEIETLQAKVSLARQIALGYVTFFGQ